MVKETAGVLVLSDEGEVRFATGLARRAEVAQALARRWNDPAGRPGGLFACEAGGVAFSAVAAGAAGATAFVVFAGDAGDVLFEFAASVGFADEIVRHLLSNPYEAVTVVDREGIVRFISPVHERFFGLGRGEGVGHHVTEVIENTRLHEVARTGKAEIGDVQQMRGTTRVVTRMPVLDAAGAVVGAVGQVMFKGPEQLSDMSAEVARLRAELSHYRRALAGGSELRGLGRIVGASAVMERLREQVRRIAPLDVPVLIVGESGTGKELVAQAIHQLSRRSGESMVMVNAAAMPASLAESELFGYEPGAFTGAERKGRRGKFEQADHGTLYLDEVGDMSLEIQVKLLRVLQDGSFERVGGDRRRISDFRLVSASNRDFQAMIDAGQFRLDLFYRLSAVTLRVPPLREHLEDVEEIAQLALAAFSTRHATKVKRLAPDVAAFLREQPWPGNVRQLVHAVEAAAIFSDSDRVTIDDFVAQRADEAATRRGHALRPFSGAVAPAPVTIAPGARGAGPAGVVGSAGIIAAAAAPVPAPPAAGAGRGSVRAAVHEVEARLIREALQRCQGNKKRAAIELGISRSYLYKRLAALGGA